MGAGDQGDVSASKSVFGVKPHYIAIPGRIKELAEAIIQCSNDTSGTCVKWAEEIIELSHVMEHLSKKVGVY